jgi:hypothetical protein
MRFLYSSSKVQVGTVVVYIYVMVISKIFSFIYDGYTTIAVYLSLWVLLLHMVYIVQKEEKISLITIYKFYN